jgi:hypothetical protein
MRSRRLPARRVVLGAGLLCLGALALYPCAAQQVYRNHFESNRPSWVKGNTDAGEVEAAHQVVEQGRPASGPRAEYIKVTARQGSHVYYQLPTKRAPVEDDLTISLWLKANRPGAQLLARVVLPNERDPFSYSDRLTVLIRGDAYRLAGRWQQLRLDRAVALCQKQQQMIQAQLKRALNFKDAYIDQLVLNVYGGPGDNEVWIQDLEMGPVLEDPPPEPAAPAEKTPGRPTALPRPAGPANVVVFNDSQLLVNGKRFFFRGIRLTETDPAQAPKVMTALRYAGFNTLWVDAAAPAPLVRQAAELGFRLVPALPVPSDTHLVSTEGLSQEIAQFAEPGDVLFWDLGGSLTHLPRDVQGLTRSAQLVRMVDPMKPLAADVWDGLRPYARSVNLLGVHRWPLMTDLELPAYRGWLEQRLRLAELGQPGTFLWTWVQTHAPAWHTDLAYDRKGGAFAEPVGPQPEQVRLVAYHALAAGCRGLGFSSDRFLADGFQGRDRLLGVALLNQELAMLEPLVVTAGGPPTWIDTSIPEVKAAVFRTEKGILVLALWCGRGAQFVPGQAAVKGLTMVVPQVPQDMQAWEVTPGDVHGLAHKRVVGGTQVTVGEFGLTTAVVFTADLMLVKRFQEQCHDQRQVAAQWTYLLALHERDKVVRIERELEQAGHSLPDGRQLLEKSQQYLKAAKGYWDGRLFGECYRESQRALRPVRILMRAQWDEAVKKLDGNPVASPYAVSFYTLPRHWPLLEQVKASRVGANLLRGGGFEADPPAVLTSWVQESHTLDPVEVRAERVAHLVPGTPVVPVKATTPAAVAKKAEKFEKVEMPALTAEAKKEAEAKKQVEARRKAAAVEPKEGKQCLMLQAKAKDPAAVPVALEGTYLAVTSPAVRLQPGTLVQISAWVNIPAALGGSADGALFFDSAGGEPLAVRLAGPTGEWKKYTLYRRVPAEGTVSVTLALTGLGTAYFDDVRIEPLLGR